VQDRESSGREAQVCSDARQAYEAKVAVEALDRAGQTPKLKGVVHEVLFKDSLNANPGNILNGNKAVLTKSTTTVRDDVLVLSKTGKVIQRFQLKDTPKSITNTVKQVQTGKYAGTKLVGTKETVNAYQQASKSVTQQMTSSGVSSTKTELIAAKALGKVPGTAALGAAAKTGGAMGACVGAVVGALGAAGDLKDGAITPGDFAGTVAVEALKGAATATASTVASSVVAGTAGAVASTAIAAAGSAAGATALGTALVAAAPFAPVIVGFAAATWVGSKVGRWLSDIRW